MKAFIVFAHAEQQSFNGALMRVAQDTLRTAGHTVQVSDLSAMKFDPVSDRRNFASVKNPDYFKQQIEVMHATEMGGFAPEVEAELRKMETCDLMIWRFPLWWFGLPGILKGWADRVFAMGRACVGARFYENGVCKGKRAVAFAHDRWPRDGLPEGRMERGHPRHPPPNSAGVLRFTGWEVLSPNIVYSPVRVSDQERQERLAAWAARLRVIESERPIEVGEQ